MQCLHCAHEKTHVLETRRLNGNVYRRRQCAKCFKVFVSEERSSPKFKMPVRTGSTKPRASRSLAIEQTKFDTSSLKKLGNVWK